MNGIDALSVIGRSFLGYKVSEPKCDSESNY